MAQEGNHELSVQRRFNASQSTLYKAFTEAGHLEQWWVPQGSPLFIARFDLKKNGVCLYNYQDEAGNTWWCKFSYQEIHPQKKISFLSSFCDENGKILRAPFNAAWPLEISNTWKFNGEAPGQGLLTITLSPYGATPEEQDIFTAALPKMGQDFELLLDRLAVYTASLH